MKKQPTYEESIENLLEDFGKQFDELGLKPPKNSMPGMEREIIKDYFRKALHQHTLSIIDSTIERIEGMKKEYQNPEFTYPSDVDITELPEGLIAETNGIKKGINAGLNLVLESLKK